MNLNFSQQEVLREVIDVFFRERLMTGNHYHRKCRQHIPFGNISYIRATLKKAGVDPQRLDAIMPLIHG